MSDEVARGSAIACHRCGVCCERWQPLVTPAEMARLAAYLDMDEAAFRAGFTVPYPFSADDRLLGQEDGRCRLLRYVPIAGAPGVRRAGCGVHPARPDACRDWTAGLDKRECVEGAGRFAGADGRIDLHVLYPDRGEAAEFLDRCAAAGLAPLSPPCPADPRAWVMLDRLTLLPDA